MTENRVDESTAAVTFFACGAGNGNRTRSVSLGIRYGPTIYVPVAGSDVVVSDLS
jgi:hypothetical protein